jgi:hypothetical protein
VDKENSESEIESEREREREISGRGNELIEFWKYERRVATIRKKYVLEDRQVCVCACVRACVRVCV